MQRREILNGLIGGYDASVYADPVFDHRQMEAICKGIKRGVNVSVYAKPEIRAGQEKGLDVSAYAKPEFNYMQMHYIGTGLEHELDVSIYAKPEYTYVEMEEMVNRLEKERGWRAGGLFRECLADPITLFAYPVFSQRKPLCFLTSSLFYVIIWHIKRKRRTI
jgi:MoaA/NifB/PqqE/SkfB family radical SAM enzyme